MLFPKYLDDWVDENNPVRVVDAFIDMLDLAELEFEGVEPAGLCVNQRTQLSTPAGVTLVAPHPHGIGRDRISLQPIQ